MVLTEKGFSMRQLLLLCRRRKFNAKCPALFECGTFISILAREFGVARSLPGRIEGCLPVGRVSDPVLLLYNIHHLFHSLNRACDIGQECGYEVGGVVHIGICAGEATYRSIKMVERFFLYAVSDL